MSKSPLTNRGNGEIAVKRVSVSCTKDNKELKVILQNRFRSARHRCTNPKNNRYHLYGARGVKFEWKDFPTFMGEMYPSFVLHLSQYGLGQTQLDRIDSDGNYNKENCRWVTLTEQQNNKRCIKLLTFNGKNQTLTRWCAELGLNLSRTYQRIYMYGWTIEDAFTSAKQINQFV